MRSWMAFLIAASFAAAAAQTGSPATTASPQSSANQADPATVSPQPSRGTEADTVPPGHSRQVTVPADTEVLLQLKNAIDTKNAHVGDGVYCQTTFPVVVDNVVAIPAGAYVKGAITRVQRAGKISGRAEVLFHFTSVIFPNGYTVEMPGSLHGDPGNAKTKIADEEGTVQTDGHDKVKQLPDAGRDAAYGSIGGAIAGGNVNAARIGGGIGAAIGLASILMSHGADVRIEPGAALTMRLQRPLLVDVTSTTGAQMQLTPRDSSNRLAIPSAVPKK